MPLGEDLSPGVKLISAAGLLILMMFSIHFLYNFFLPLKGEPAMSLSLSKSPENWDGENHVKIVEIVNNGREGLYLDEAAIILSGEEIGNYRIDERENDITISPEGGRIILSHYNLENRTLINPEVGFLWIGIEGDEENISIYTDRPVIKENIFSNLGQRAVLKKREGSSIRGHLGLSEDSDLYLSVYYFPTNEIIFEEKIGNV